MQARDEDQRPPFSFHCTICFEVLNLTDRAPAVLPCGHTYLCMLCANQLERCMECRAPLTMSVEQKAAPAPPPPEPMTRREILDMRRRANGAWRNQRYATPSSSPLQNRENVNVSKPVLKRLPIPKNHVLMCLIDAVQNCSTGNIEKDGYESGDDDELVLQGMRMMGFSSGTYIVREPKGLKVHPVKSKGTCSSRNLTIADGGQEESRIIQYGQTVQILLFENGIATIARGAGCILVDNSSQLVKVGEVTDEACKLEAARRILTMQQEELEAKLKRVKKSQKNISRKLEEVLSDPESSDPIGPVPLDLSDIPQPEIRSPPPQDETPPMIQETRSYDEQQVSIFPGTAIQHPPDSVDNFSMYLTCYSFDDQQLQWPTLRPSGGRPTIHRGRRRTMTDASTGTVGRSSIDFASGFSGHRGLNRGGTNNKQKSQRHVLMMSNHRGIGPVKSSSNWH